MEKNQEIIGLTSEGGGSQEGVGGPGEVKEYDAFGAFGRSDV